MIHKIETPYGTVVGFVRRYSIPNSFCGVVDVGFGLPTPSYTGTASAEQHRTMNPTPKGSEPQ
jgi:hypothetical protein